MIAQSVCAVIVTTTLIQGSLTMLQPSLHRSAML